MASNAKNLSELLNTDSTIVTADIPDDAVTAAKIDDDGTGFTLGDLTVSGNTSVASSSGNVSIGTTIQPPVGLTVHVGDADNKGVNLTRLETSGNPSDNEELGSYAWNSNAESVNHLGSAEAKIVARASQNHSGTLAGTDMEFYVKPNGTGPGSGPTEKMKIHNGGVVSIPDGIVLGSGLNAVTANTLNDYEEGTFTPTLTSEGSSAISVGYAGTPGSQYTVGSYTKVGNTVHFQIILDVDSYSGGQSSNNNLLLSGLPFTSFSYITGGNGGGAVIYNSGHNTNPESGIILGSQTNIRLYRAGAATASQTGDFTSSSYIQIAGSYKTDL